MGECVSRVIAGIWNVMRTLPLGSEKWDLKMERRNDPSLFLSLSPPPSFFFLLAKREQINEEVEVTNDLQSSILRQQSGEFRQPFVRQSRNLITSPACLRNTESVTACQPQPLISEKEEIIVGTCMIWNTTSSYFSQRLTCYMALATAGVLTVKE